jgi:para-aminobenzoate synthetase component 1
LGDQPASPLADGPPRIEDTTDWVDPLAALAVLKDESCPALLYSGLPDHRSSRYSILACSPLADLTLRSSEARIVWHAGGRRRTERLACGDPFALLRRLAPIASGGSVAGLPFTGGAIGWLGYGLRRAIERLPAASPDPLDQPDAWFAIYDASLVFDHRERTVSIITVPASLPTPLARKRERERRRHLRLVLEAARRSRAAERPDKRRVLTKARPATSRSQYLKHVRRVLDLIAAGDLYQANLSHRISCDLRRDPHDLFRALMRRNPSPFAAYLGAPDVQVVCASPERFVSLRDGVARSSPIKGTRPRGASAEADRRLARELTRSPKDRAENVMIADLVRNDLGRVCAPGTIRAETLCGLETFATVHHLVYTITGRLRPDKDRIDLLRALFPGGSMTGAPKIRAMEVIADLEGEERGIYSGSIGYLSRDGAVDFNIVIRTIVCAGRRADLRVGGGIVADSDPADEYRETLDKARALLDALGAGLRTSGRSTG